MRSTTPAILSLLTLLLGSQAKPVPNDQSLFLRGTNVTLELRQCASYCGADLQFCCSANEACTTLQNNVATCMPGAQQPAPTGAGGGNYQVYTTTYVETDLQTITTIITAFGNPGGSAVGGSPPPSSPTGQLCPGSGETPCGWGLCCASDQQCVSPGTCGAIGSAPVRPTSNTVETVTSTAAATTTEPFSAPVASDGSVVSAEPDDSGLSGGAIAGIVIGVLAGLIILFFVLACLCCKGLIDGILAIFGCGRKRRTEETYIATHHSHHGSAAPPRRKWFGMGGGPSKPQPKKKEGMGFLGVAGILGTIAVLLGLKRRHDKRDEKSDYTDSVSGYTYSDYTTSESSASSDRRTRTTRHSRHSRR